MASRTDDTERADLSDDELKEFLARCDDPFALRGPLVQPDAGCWFRDDLDLLRMPRRDELIGKAGKRSSKLQEVINKAKDEEARTDPSDPNYRFLKDLEFD